MRRKLLLFALGLAGLGVLGAGAFSVYWNWFLCAGDACPSIAQFDEYRPAQPARVYAADGRFIAEVGLERRSVVRLEQIPQQDRKSTRLNSSHGKLSRMPSSA